MNEGKKAAPLRMTPGEGMLNYRSPQVYAYVIDDGGRAGRPGSRV